MARATPTRRARVITRSFILIAGLSQAVLQVVQRLAGEVETVAMFDRFHDLTTVPKMKVSPGYGCTLMNSRPITKTTEVDFKLYQLLNTDTETREAVLRLLAKT